MTTVDPTGCAGWWAPLFMADRCHSPPAAPCAGDGSEGRCGSVWDARRRRIPGESGMRSKSRATKPGDMPGEGGPPSAERTAATAEWGADAAEGRRSSCSTDSACRSSGGDAKTAVMDRDAGTCCAAAPGSAMTVAGYSLSARPPCCHASAHDSCDADCGRLWTCGDVIGDPATRDSEWYTPPASASVARRSRSRSSRSEMKPTKGELLIADDRPRQGFCQNARLDSARTCLEEQCGKWRAKCRILCTREQTTEEKLSASAPTTSHP